MIKKQTVLVLGAGASYDLGFPLGVKLWNNIYGFILKQSNGFTNQATGGGASVSIDNAKLLANLLKEAVGLGLVNVKTEETNERFVKKFAEDLFDAQPKSIDQFLKDRSEYSLIGRICIVFCISRYEDKHSENFSPIKKGEDFVIPDFGWYEYLWRKMTEDIDSLEEFKKRNKITIITFNYDRSLEFYLFKTLKAKYNESDANTADVFKEIKIKHIYGRLAPFYWEQNYLNPNSDLSEKALAMECNDFIPWEPSELFRIWGDVGTHGKDARDFESNESNRPALTYESNESKRSVITEEARSQLVRRFIDAANDIKIYSEVLEAHKSREYLEDLMKAKHIYFLGFGYHEQNLLALGLKKGVLSEDTQILGTAYDVNDREMQDIHSRLAKSIGWKNRGFTGPADEVVKLANKWDGQDNKASIIKEFFREFPDADLV